MSNANPFGPLIMPVLNELNLNNPFFGKILYFIWDILIRSIIVYAIYSLGTYHLSLSWIVIGIMIKVLHNHYNRQHREMRDIGANNKLFPPINTNPNISQNIPSWIKIPEVNKAGWINTILSLLWPKCEEHIVLWLRESVEFNLASLCANYNLTDFKLGENLIIGQPPLIEAVKVHETLSHTQDIVIDAKISFISECDIDFHLNGLRGNLRNLTVVGKLRILTKPLSEPPYLGEIKVYFLLPPAIDFEINGFAQHGISGVSLILKKYISEKIATMMILPNVLCLPEFKVQLINIYPSKSFKKIEKFGPPNLITHTEILPRRIE